MCSVLIADISAMANCFSPRRRLYPPAWKPYGLASGS